MLQILFYRKMFYIDNFYTYPFLYIANLILP